MSTNRWCEILKISPPKLEAVVGHREANTFALLLVALLERGAPMTLTEVATRFQAAGVATQERALRSLQRCQPGRPPVYREGDAYQLDPHDDDLDLWTFRLGLRPAKGAPYLPTAPAAVPGPETPLSPAELDESWQDVSLHSWPLQRIVLAVLDAVGGPLWPEEVQSEVSKRHELQILERDRSFFSRKASAVVLQSDGRWDIAPDSALALTQTRIAVRQRIEINRRYARYKVDPAQAEAHTAAREKEKVTHVKELARLKRAILVVFPPDKPVAVTLLDCQQRQITTLVGAELALVANKLQAYDVLGAVDVRKLLRTLGIDNAPFRLAELGPPQKTKKYGRSGRTLHITTELLVRGSCGIAKPLGDPSKMAEFVSNGDWAKLKKRMEADAKSLYALYQYGRLHKAVRLLYGPLDERLPVPWVDWDETGLHTLMETALAWKVPLEIVVGHPQDWDAPWSQTLLVDVVKPPGGWEHWLFDRQGAGIEPAYIQAARLAVVVH